jgi:hypothetical protein
MSSPTSARAIASRIALHGFVTVSLRKSMISRESVVMTGILYFAWPKAEAWPKKSNKAL